MSTPHFHAPANDARRWIPMVEVTRGGMVESVHSGAAVVVEAGGRVVATWGDFEQPIYPRSAIKAIQALPLIETGAADAYAVSDEEVALACASHCGELEHASRVALWLARIGCTADDLGCGAHWPSEEEAARLLAIAGERPSPLHNNCSGKHAGMLTTARAQGESLKGYTDITHPVQQRVLGVLEAMTGHDLSSAARGIDGCSIPTIAVPLGGIALAMARLADPRGLPSHRAEAARRITHAWRRHPFLIAGTGAFDTLATEAMAGRGMVKIGAEGVMCACLPGEGLGVALKIADGAGRAAEVAMAAILTALGVLTETNTGAWARPTLRNRRGLAVGALQPADFL